MHGVSKLFGGKAIDSFNRHFERSRRILTVLYVGVAACLLIVSMAVSHSLLSNRFEARLRPVRAYVGGARVLLPPPVLSIGAADIRRDLLEVMIMVNSILLLCAGILSYWFAGITLRPLKKSYDRQRQLVNDMSHELRTPLAILLIQLENMRSGTNNSLVESSVEEVHRMERLVKDMLYLGRLEEGQGEVLRTPLDIGHAVEESIHRLDHLARQRGVTLSYAVSPAGTVVANPDEVSHILDNIVTNAIVYNREGGSVEVALTCVDDMAQLTVRDTGIGMSSAQVARIFDRFYRAEHSRTKNGGGSGLGLAIVKGIVDALGGSIRVESEPDKGTTVTVTLPVHKDS